MGLNGYIWVAKHVYISPEMANQPEGLYSDQNDEISEKERSCIARVSNLITCLANQKAPIYETILIYIYEASLKYSNQELQKSEIQKILVDMALARVDAED